MLTMGMNLSKVRTDELLDELATRFAHMVFGGAQPEPMTVGSYKRTRRVKGNATVCLALCDVTTQEINEDVEKAKKN